MNKKQSKRVKKWNDDLQKRSIINIEFPENKNQSFDDIQKLEKTMEKHKIEINGSGYCFANNSKDIDITLKDFEKALKLIHESKLKYRLTQAYNIKD